MNELQCFGTPRLPAADSDLAIAADGHRVHHGGMRPSIRSPGIFALLGLALAAAPAAHAQQFIATVAAACGSPAVGGQLTAPASAAVTAGDTIVVAVASSSDAVAELRLSDSRGNVYRPFGAERADVRRFAAVNFVAPAATALTTSDSFTLQVGHPAPAQEVCFRVAIFRAVVSSSGALDTFGGGEDSGTALSVSAPTGHYAGMLNVASFAYAGDAGTLSTTGSHVALPRVCSAGNALCLVAAYAVGGAAGTQTVTVSASNSVPWAGSLSSLYALANLDVFKNGFE